MYLDIYTKLILFITKNPANTFTNTFTDTFTNIFTNTFANGGQFPRTDFGAVRGSSPLPAPPGSLKLRLFWEVLYFSFSAFCVEVNRMVVRMYSLHKSLYLFSIHSWIILLWASQPNQVLLLFHIFICSLDIYV